MKPPPPARPARPRRASRFKPAALTAAAVAAFGLTVGAALAASAFNDVADNHRASAEITAAHQVGVFQGYGDGTFRPAEKLTRGQAELVIHRMLTWQGTDDDGNFEISRADAAVLAMSGLCGLDPDRIPACAAVAAAEVQAAYDRGYNNGFDDGLDAATPTGSNPPTVTTLPPCVTVQCELERVGPTCPDPRAIGTLSDNRMQRLCHVWHGTAYVMELAACPRADLAWANARSDIIICRSDPPPPPPCGTVQCELERVGPTCPDPRALGSLPWTMNQLCRVWHGTAGPGIAACSRADLAWDGIRERIVCRPKPPPAPKPTIAAGEDLATSYGATVTVTVPPGPACTWWAHGQHDPPTSRLGRVENRLVAGGSFHLTQGDPDPNRDGNLTTWTYQVQCGGGPFISGTVTYS